MVFLAAYLDVCRIKAAARVDLDAIVCCLGVSCGC